MEESASLEPPELKHPLAVHCDSLPVDSTGGDAPDRVLVGGLVAVLVAAAVETRLDVESDQKLIIADVKFVKHGLVGCPSEV